MTDSTESQITGSEVAGLFQLQNEDALTGEERSILASLLSRDDRVDLAVPDEMDARELWRTLELCSRVFVRVRRASGQLKLLIGRALLVIQKTPEVYESRGFSSFDSFMSDEDRGLPFICQISRAELYKAKSVAGSVGPGMNLEDARNLGFSKMQLIAGVTEPGSPTQTALIEAAKTETIPQLKERIARSSLQYEASDLEWDSLVVTMTKTQKSFVLSFLDNPQVSAYCGTESRGGKLERLVQECSQEWQIRAMIIEGEATAV